MSGSAITGCTVVDGTGRAPIRDAVVLVEGNRVTHVGSRAEVQIPPGTAIAQFPDNYVIPGLMDANVHLLYGGDYESLVRYEGHYEELVLESAQIALRAGVTSVFDTWGAAGPTTRVRDRINDGAATASRIFAAGNIIGLSGPLSTDFHPADASANRRTVEEINAAWELGTGRELLWQSPQDVRSAVRQYIESSGVDFIKYASSGHSGDEERFICFSGEAQQAIVAEAHEHGITAQSHSTSIESLRLAVAAGCDLLQHPDITGPRTIPRETIDDIVEQRIGCALVLTTRAHQEWLAEHCPEQGSQREKETNADSLIAAGARVTFSTDGAVLSRRHRSHPRLGPTIRSAPDLPFNIGSAHLSWLVAACEHGMTPGEALMGATSRVAESYHVDHELGTVEPGKFADLVVIRDDPLSDVRRVGDVLAVMKDGEFVDRTKLPEHPLMTSEGTVEGSSVI